MDTKLHFVKSSPRCKKSVKILNPYDVFIQIDKNSYDRLKTIIFIINKKLKLMEMCCFSDFYKNCLKDTVNYITSKVSLEITQEKVLENIKAWLLSNIDNQAYIHTLHIEIFLELIVYHPMKVYEDFQVIKIEQRFIDDQQQIFYSIIQESAANENVISSTQ